MRRAYRCRRCKQILGYLYDEQIDQPLPKCPKGHRTELVPLVGDGEFSALMSEVNLEPSARESQKVESRNPDPHTYRQRMGKQKTDS